MIVLITVLMIDASSLTLALPNRLICDESWCNIEWPSLRTDNTLPMRSSSYANAPKANIHHEIYTLIRLWVLLQVLYCLATSDMIQIFLQILNAQRLSLGLEKRQHARKFVPSNRALLHLSKYSFIKQLKAPFKDHLCDIVCIRTYTGWLCHLKFIAEGSLGSRILSKCIFLVWQRSINLYLD